MTPSQSTDKTSRVSWVLVGFVAFQAILWFAWVIPSRYYVGFDEGWHLEVSQHLYYRLVDHGILGLTGKFLHAMQAKPPLVSLLPLPMYLIFGNHAWVATAVNLIWLLLLNVYFFRLVRYFWGEGPALIACVSLQTMPLFPGLSRMVMAEYGTAVLVVIFMYFLFTQLPSTKRAVILGILLGLGLLEKVLFPTYVMGPLIWAMWTELRQGKQGQTRLLRLWLLSLGLAFVLAGPWYLINFRHLMGYTFQSTYGEMAKVYRFGTTLKDLRALWEYLLEFLNTGITAYQGILLGIAWLGGLFLGRKESQKSRPVTIGIALWFLVPFVMYLPSLYRNYKFMMPFFAPVSIALGVVLWRLLSFFKKAQGRWMALILLLVWPNLEVLYASFPLAPINQPYRLLMIGPFDFLPQRGYVGFPRTGRWPYEEVLEFVASDGACIKETTGTNPTLGMVCDVSEFNRSTMLYIQKKLRLPVEVYWAPLGGSADPRYDFSAALALTSQQSYIVFRVPNLMNPEFTNRLNDQIRESIHRGELPFRLIKEFPLPDGAKALLYRRQTLPSQ